MSLLIGLSGSSSQNWPRLATLTIRELVRAREAPSNEAGLAIRLVQLWTVTFSQVTHSGPAEKTSPQSKMSALRRARSEMIIEKAVAHLPIWRFLPPKTPPSG